MKPSILVCTDFSKCSEAALPRAAEIAVRDSARVFLLNVINSSRHVAGGAHKWDQHSMQRLKEARRRHFAELSDNDVQYGSVAGPHPAQTICNIAKEHRASLIVLGSHGRTGLLRQLLGSVAESVVRNAHCSVLVVRTIPDEVAGSKSGLSRG